jgi:hypothetical protein
MGNSDRIREDVGLTVRVEQDGEALVLARSGISISRMSRRSRRSYGGRLPAMPPG